MLNPKVVFVTILVILGYAGWTGLSTGVSKAMEASASHASKIEQAIEAAQAGEGK